MSLLGQRLRYARERKNITQTDVWKRTGINNKTLSRYENGGSEPDYETLHKLADFYDVSADYLLGIKDNPSREKTKKQTLKEFLEQPGVPYDENTFLPEEQIKPLRELLEQVVNSQAYKDAIKKDKKKSE